MFVIVGNIMEEVAGDSETASDGKRYDRGVDEAFHKIKNGLIIELRQHVSTAREHSYYYVRM